MTIVKPGAEFGRNPKFPQSATFEEIRPGVVLRIHYTHLDDAETITIKENSYLNGATSWWVVAGSGRYADQDRSLADMGVIPYSRHCWNKN